MPFVDLRTTHDPVKDAIVADIAELFDTSAFSNGPQVAEFERLFGAFCGSPYCVGLASGLDALKIGLLAGGIEPGDEVIVPANTFAATFEAVTQAGGIPTVIDVQESDYNLDPQAAESAVTSRTRFVLPVHLYGQMADMRQLSALASERSLKIIEDACQAHGAERDGLRAGAVGVVGAFSFYPTKNLGAIGDAGALVTDDAEVAVHARALREHGQTAKYRYSYEGYTSRLDTIQAIALLRKLPLLDRCNHLRRAAASFYSERLHNVGDIRLPPVAEGSTSVWHLFVIRTRDPVALAEFLAQHGIATGRHYPEPPHLSDAYRGLGFRPGAFPITEAISREGLSLPLFPGITEEQLEHVCVSINGFFSGG